MKSVKCNSYLTHESKEHNEMSVLLETLFFEEGSSFTSCGYEKVVLWIDHSGGDILVKSVTPIDELGYGNPLLYIHHCFAGKDIGQYKMSDSFTEALHEQLLIRDPDRRQNIDQFLNAETESEKYNRLKETVRTIYSELAKKQHSELD